jgi:Zn-dependent oligopeptidase
MSNNPLLNYTEFVPYQEIKAEHIKPAVEEAVKNARAQLEEILKVDRSSINFKNTLFAFIELDKVVEKVWSPVQNLLSLMGADAFRDAANESRPVVVEFYNDYSLDERVFKLVKDYSLTSEAKSLTGEEKRHLENTLRGFKLSGAELEGKDKEEFKKLNLELSELSQKFSDNATDSKFELILTTKDELAGLPEDAIDAAKLKANEYRKKLGADKVPEGSVLFNLDYPSYGPFMKYSSRSDLKKKLYFEYLSKGTTKASRGLLGEKKDSLDNELLIEKIFKAKHRKANLLGFKNYAELSLETKMAPSPTEVKSFLERLAVKAKPLAQKESQELLDFQKEIGYINSENNPDKVYPWDKEYLSEKLREKKYSFDTNLTKPYFELEQTINGMFDIATKLFGIDFKVNKNIQAWHEDVTVYEVMEAGRKVGTFYMDLYPRDIKRGGAWVMPLVQASVDINGKKILPQCTLTCNLTKPTEAQPSLLNHTEVTTLFHEFGHALHHLLSTVRLDPLSGTNVEWDFVELPSQLNENFVWEKESLMTFAKHYKTGEPIPDTLLESMLKARTFNEGLACIRQIEFGLFDLSMYMLEDDSKYQRPLNVFKKIVDSFAINEVLDGTNFPCAFSHIFAGGYAAGYYSYKWAEVLEADAFSRFQKEGVLNSKVGKEYRESILEKGDSEEPMKLFVSFMNREPNEDALLKRMGLKGATV